MNREIKFKIWDNASGQWADKNSFELLQSEKENTYSFRNYLVNNEPDGEVKYILCQFTGLKDKNGKDIYEGDVLVMNIERDFKKSHSKPFPMQWNPHNAAWTNFHPREIVEVIGNIYENPELLKTD